MSSGHSMLGYLSFQEIPDSKSPRLRDSKYYIGMQALTHSGFNLGRRLVDRTKIFLRKIYSMRIH